MTFFHQTGRVALGSRMRMLTEKITEDAANIYSMYGVELHPKWFPVYYVLSEGEAKAVTAIAKEIRHSHPSVSKTVREMAKAGLVVKKTGADKRKNVVQLSAKGLAISEKIKDQFADVNAAIEAITAQSQHDLWQAIEEWEFLLGQRSLLQRVQEQRKQRESQHVRIVDFELQYAEVFKALNEEWINKFFRMEEADHVALSNYQSYILDRGGHIFVALYKDEPVGVCAMLKMDSEKYDFELAKMAVAPAHQGKNIGWLLGQAVIAKAKELKARNLYLESNTILHPAISLYHKLGFRKIVGPKTPYERCNIQMVMEV